MPAREFTTFARDKVNIYAHMMALHIIGKFILRELLLREREKCISNKRYEKISAPARK